MDRSIRYLERLARIPGFKITPTPNSEGTLGCVEANGIKFNASFLNVEEGLENAFFYIQARMMALDLIKTMKINLE